MIHELVAQIHTPPLTPPPLYTRTYTHHTSRDIAADDARTGGADPQGFPKKFSKVSFIVILCIVN